MELVYISRIGRGYICVVRIDIPREEGPSSKGGIQRGVSVRACGGVKLSSCTETVEGIEQP